MRIVHRAREAVDILACSGPVAGSAAAASLGERVDVLIRLGEPIVVLDLTDVGTLEDGFLAEVVACRQRIAEAGGLLKLVVDPARHARFREAGLDRVCELHTDEDDVMESFAPETATVGIP